MSEITSFRNKYRFLSNFYPANIEWDDVIYPSVEHAYQASKFRPESKFRVIILGLSAGDAKKFANDTVSAIKGQVFVIDTDLNPYFEDSKLGIMYKLLTEKFKHLVLRRKLLDTGDIRLIEGNNWNDTFWGVCDGEGKNHLGNILMKVRNDIREDLTKIKG